MLILARRMNESIIIGDEIIVSVVDIKGDQVKLGITAPERVKVYRREVYEAIQSENRAAAMAGTNLPVLDTLVRKDKGAAEETKPKKPRRRPTE